MSLSPSRIAAPAFEIASFARAPMFPAVRFASEMEFRDYLADNQSQLDARAAYERSLAVTKALTRPGTCAPCLRAAEFTSPAAEGTRPPLWRDSQTCDCRDRLSNQHRALLHFVQAAGVFPWTRLLLAGPPSALDLRLSSMVQTAIRLPETGAMAEGEGFHSRGIAQPSRADRQTAGAPGRHPQPIARRRPVYFYHAVRPRRCAS